MDQIRTEVGRVVVGQEDLVDGLLSALVCGGHVLIEGIPGLAKTLAVSTLAQALDISFNRIQFTPDLLPGDVVGTQIFDPIKGTFSARKGLVFCHVLLADEINRSPAKVQSALLEAMQEKQVTIGDEAYQLEEPYLVLATQNPIEQEGTYPLPEAQLDRFMYKLRVGYPTMDDEREVLRRMSKSAPNLEVKPVLSQKRILALRACLDEIHMDDSVEDYILRIVSATRNPDSFGIEGAEEFERGASPRATIFLAKAAKSAALADGRDYVVPGDVKRRAPDVLRHRIARTYSAEASGVTTDELAAAVLAKVELPQ